jgi:hypothetical protein
VAIISLDACPDFCESLVCPSNNLDDLFSQANH